MSAVTARRARVRLLRDLQTGCPGAPGHVRYWLRGMECVLWQQSLRRGRALDPDHDRWWTDFDIDLAHILPADAVEVLRVLEERTAL